MMGTAAIKNCLGTLSKDVYFCGSNDSDCAPTIFTKNVATLQIIKALFQRCAVEDAQFTSIQVKTTVSLKLNKAKSLEGILAAVPNDFIYYDPTATIERAKAFVCLAKQARMHLIQILYQLTHIKLSKTWGCMPSCF